VESVSEVEKRQILHSDKNIKNKWLRMFSVWKTIYSLLIPFKGSRFNRDPITVSHVFPFVGASPVAIHVPDEDRQPGAHICLLATLLTAYLRLQVFVDHLYGLFFT